DSFNIILLNNIVLGVNHERFQVAVPDFLIYTYQPFVRYLALKYNFDAFMGGARASLDASHNRRLENWTALSERVLDSCRKTLKHFNSTISVIDADESPEDETEMYINLLPAEIVERVAARERAASKRQLPHYIKIRTGEQIYSLRPGAAVLVSQNGSL